MKQRNKFEMEAHQVQFQHPFKKKQHPSFDHTIETYSKGKIDWWAVGGCAFLVLFGIAMLIVIKYLGV